MPCNDEELKMMVDTMRKKNKYKQRCIEEQDLLRKCIYCKYLLNSQEWSCVMEKYIMEKLLIEKPTDEISGDGIKNGKTIEIKVSLGSKNGQFNFVQIRPEHNVDLYIFIAYNLYEEEYGKVYTILYNSSELYKLLPDYGSYAHGTIQKLGKITYENIINNKNIEYALRPNILLKDTSKSKKLWNILIQHQIPFNSEYIK